MSSQCQVSHMTVPFFALYVIGGHTVTRLPQMWSILIVFPKQSSYLCHFLWKKGTYHYRKINPHEPIPDSQ
jgi:hypothetical protein